MTNKRRMASRRQQERTRWWAWAFLFLIVIGVYVGVMVWVGLNQPDSTTSATQAGLVSRAVQSLDKFAPVRKLKDLVGEYATRLLSRSTPDPTPGKADKVGMPIYFINLDRSPDRRTAYEAQVSKLGLQAERIEAIDGKLIKNRIQDTVQGISFTNTFVNTQNNNELACCLSHILAIRAAYQAGHEFALITEDDAGWDLYDQWYRTIPELVKELSTVQPDWQMVSLFDNKPSLTKLPFHAYRQGSGLVAYVVNRSGMEAVMTKMVDTASNTITLDQTRAQKLNSDFLLAKTMSCWTASPCLFIAGDGESTIDPVNANRVTKWSRNSAKAIQQQYANSANSANSNNSEFTRLASSVQAGSSQ